MNKTTEYTKAVIAITELARGINANIGRYQEHFSIENFGFIIRLTNGGIKMPREFVQEYEMHPSRVTREAVKVVAESYWKS